MRHRERIYGTYMSVLFVSITVAIFVLVAAYNLPDGLDQVLVIVAGLTTASALAASQRLVSGRNNGQEFTGISVDKDAEEEPAPPSRIALDED